ncbi:hypothetical protein SUGI_0991800 [Cryptomeria japonica]|nr:hypothetical protein SUGI_0991800 [Cryptomeria japonica]
MAESMESLGLMVMRLEGETSPCAPARLASSSWWRVASNFASLGNENRLPSTAWLKVFHHSRPFAEEGMGSFSKDPLYIVGRPFRSDYLTSCAQKNRCKSKRAVDFGKCNLGFVWRRARSTPDTASNQIFRVLYVGNPVA